MMIVRVLAGLVACGVASASGGSASAQLQLRASAAARGTTTYVDQFCVNNEASADLAFTVYTSTNNKAASVNWFSVAQTKCVYLTSTTNPDTMTATVKANCLSCSDPKSHIPAFSYQAYSNNKITYKCTGTEWSITCAQE
jgi:hypothetical protein